MNEIIYCDMDGVLADFNAEPNAVERFKSEKGFFKKLKPMSINVKAIIDLISKGHKVKILTTSPHKRADKDKQEWLKEHLPMINKKDIIYGRPNKAKIEYIKKNKRKQAVLIDDYGKNLKEWRAGGGRRTVKITPNPKDEIIDYLTIKDYVEMIGY